MEQRRAPALVRIRSFVVPLIPVRRMAAALAEPTQSAQPGQQAGGGFGMNGLPVVTGTQERDFGRRQAILAKAGLATNGNACRVSARIG